MNLSESNENNKYKIIKNLSANPLKQRLLSMGFIKNTEIYILIKNKKVLKVKILNSTVVLRIEEAKFIIIEKMN